MYRVPAGVIHRSAQILSRSPRWKQKPCASLKALIYGLNTIHSMYPCLRHDFGLPQASVAVKEVVGIKTLCEQAVRTGNHSPLKRRLAALKGRDTDSFAVLAFQAALAMGRKHPVAAARDGEVMTHLEGAPPAAVGEFASRALAVLAPGTGRGGARNKGPLVQYALVREIGFLFEAITGRKPGITYVDEESKHTGRFVEFAIIVHASLGLKVNGRQILRRFHVVDVPEWRRPENAVRWSPRSKSRTESPPQ